MYDSLQAQRLREAQHPYEPTPRDKVRQEKASGLILPEPLEPREATLAKLAHTFLQERTPTMSRRQHPS